MTVAEMEQQKITDIAAEYSRKGYAVQVRPHSEHLPPFLRAFQPEIIATSPRDNVVIEVKSSSAADLRAFQALAELLETHPGWRLEVVFVNTPVAPDVPAQEDLAPATQVNRLLESAESLFRKGEIEAAVMLAWSAVEILLRRSARTAAPEVERQSSARVLKHLYSLGHVEPATYEKLLRLMEFRNAVAHGFQPEGTIPPLLEIVPEIRRLQSAA